MYKDDKLNWATAEYLMQAGLTSAPIVFIGENNKVTNTVDLLGVKLPYYVGLTGNEEYDNYKVAQMMEAVQIGNVRKIY